jgi:hypothetical protein
MCQAQSKHERKKVGKKKKEIEKGMRLRLERKKSA